MLTIDPHPLLDLGCFITTLIKPLDELPPADTIRDLMTLDDSAPLHSDDQVREAVRAVLRHGGFKPTGRSKPASEYLIKAAQDGLTPINTVVDACNVVSLHSGLPISVVDLDRCRPPLRVAIAEKGATYIFNASGQTIDLAGLLCLLDADGPCANAVKDAQRTKTNGQTRRTLSLIWGTKSLPGRTTQTVEWYKSLLAPVGQVADF